MPGRDPEAAERSSRVADAIRAEMKHQGLTGAGLRDKLREAGVQVPNDMWITRRLTGQVNLVEPVRVVYGPSDDLEAIASVLKVDPARFVRVLNRNASKTSKDSKPAPSAAADK